MRKKEDEKTKEIKKLQNEKIEIEFNPIKQEKDDYFVLVPCIPIADLIKGNGTTIKDKINKILELKNEEEQKKNADEKFKCSNEDIKKFYNMYKDKENTEEMALQYMANIDNPNQIKMLRIIHIKGDKKQKKMQEDFDKLMKILGEASEKIEEGEENSKEEKKLINKKKKEEEEKIKKNMEQLKQNMKKNNSKGGRRKRSRRKKRRNSKKTRRKY